jgi:sugar/nucleoside kinase (ribokinase family)
MSLPLTETRFDVLAIGNAIVDVIARVDDAFLEREGYEKGSMRLIDPARAEELYSRMGPGREISGGSAANTLAGVAAFGHRCAFIGQVADDQLGAVFQHDIRALGVAFDVPPRTEEPPTGRCLILVAPDGERTMNTSLGAAHYLPESAAEPELVASARFLYIEGYMWDPPEPRRAILRAIGAARAAGRKVALALSAIFLMEMYRDDFLKLLDDELVDILFCNEGEASAMMQGLDLDAATDALAARVPLLVVTHGDKGAIAVSEGRRYSVPAERVDRVVDTTGAGDLFAAGFLAGQVEGRGIEDSLRIGAIAAAEVITHYGARPDADLKALVAQKLG